jgi:hypothetical protein
MVEGCGHCRGERCEAALGNLEFRSRAFDLISFVNYTNIRLELLSPGTSGEF